jgi:hypothetical protein
MPLRNILAHNRHFLLFYHRYSKSGGTVRDPEFLSFVGYTCREPASLEGETLMK